MRHVHDHHHPQVYEQKKHQQQNQSHMTPSLPPRWDRIEEGLY